MSMDAYFHREYFLTSFISELFQIYILNRRDSREARLPHRRLLDKGIYHTIMELLRLEKTTKIIQSNRQSTLTMPSNRVSQCYTYLFLEYFHVFTCNSRGIIPTNNSKSQDQLLAFHFLLQNCVM